MLTVPRVLFFGHGSTSLHIAPIKLNILLRTALYITIMLITSTAYVNQSSSRPACRPKSRCLTFRSFFCPRSPTGWFNSMIIHGTVFTNVRVASIMPHRCQVTAKYTSPATCALLISIKAPGWYHMYLVLPGIWFHFGGCLLQTVYHRENVGLLSFPAQTSFAECTIPSAVRSLFVALV